MRGKVYAHRTSTPTIENPVVGSRGVCLPSPHRWRAPLLSAMLLLASAAAQADDYFSKVDRDGDGRVSLAEFLERMSFAFRQMDVDRDGVLEPHEQHIPDAPTITLAQHHERFTAQFIRQDTDGNGTLSPAELLAPPR
jgi:Ca2+-binding EF-hand superfamily protein